LSENCSPYLLQHVLKRPPIPLALDAVVLPFGFHFVGDGDRAAFKSFRDGLIVGEAVADGSQNRLDSDLAVSDPLILCRGSFSAPWWSSWPPAAAREITFFAPSNATKNLTDFGKSAFKLLFFLQEVTKGFFIRIENVSAHKRRLELNKIKVNSPNSGIVCDATPKGIFSVSFAASRHTRLLKYKPPLAPYLRVSPQIS
jgi:hypothetical protein